MLLHNLRTTSGETCLNRHITPEVTAQGCSNVGIRAAAVPRCGKWMGASFLCPSLPVLWGQTMLCWGMKPVESVFLHGSEKVCPLTPLCTRCQGSLMGFTDLNPKCIQRKCIKLPTSVKRQHPSFSCMSETRNYFCRKEAEGGEWQSEAAMSTIKGWLTLLCLQPSPLHQPWLSTGICPAAACWVLPLTIRFFPVSAAFPQGPLQRLQLWLSFPALAGGAPGLDALSAAGHRSPSILPAAPASCSLSRFSRCAWLMDYLPFAAWLLFFCLLTFSLLQIYFDFEILGIPLITFMFIGEVAIIRLFFLFFLILEFNYIFPSAFSYRCSN